MNATQVYEILNEAYFSDNCHEADVLHALQRRFARTRFFVDIGASLGQFTRCASQYMTNGRIIAIEADPIRFEELERNCAKWSRCGNNNCLALHRAVSDTGGPITFYSTESNVSGGLFPHEVAADAPEWKEITVPGETLDSIVGDQIPDLVKIDVEGAELRVLKGARRILAAGKTDFLIEVHNWTDPAGQRGGSDVFEFMNSCGYGYFGLAGKAYFSRSPRRRIAMRFEGVLRRIGLIT